MGNPFTLTVPVAKLMIQLFFLFLVEAIAAVQSYLLFPQNMLSITQNNIEVHKKSITSYMIKQCT